MTYPETKDTFSIVDDFDFYDFNNDGLATASGFAVTSFNIAFKFVSIKRRLLNLSRLKIYNNII